MTQHKFAYESRKYRQLVWWIALNDAPGDASPLEELSGYLTVTMLAHCYNLPSLKVAKDVQAVRDYEAEKEGIPS